MYGKVKVLGVACGQFYAGDDRDRCLKCIRQLPAMLSPQGGFVCSLFVDIDQVN